MVKDRRSEGTNRMAIPRPLKELASRMGRAGVLLLACAALASCGSRSSKPFVIGILDESAIDIQILEGFTAGMNEQGYVEGSKVTYIRGEYTNRDAAKIAAEIEKLTAAKPDAILALGGSSIDNAAKAFKGMKTPVIFAPASDNQVARVVKSIQHPGGTMTGVRIAMDRAKLLEWLTKIAPSTTLVLSPLASGPTTANNLALLTDAAAQLKLQLRTPDLRTDGDMKKAIAALPDRAAILIMSGFTSIAGFVGEATRRKVPVVSIFPEQLEQGALFTYSMDHAGIGRLAARQMGMVIRGGSPADIPVETAEFKVAINLKAATALGLSISDDVLGQAARILR